MSDTPRTDACWDNERCNIVMVMHARQLERELDEANTVSATLLTTKCRELAEVTKQRDALAEALDNCLGGYDVPSETAVITQEDYAFAKSALAAVKGGAA